MIKKGSTLLVEPYDTSWGMRYGRLIDPFGLYFEFAFPLKTA